VSNDISLFDDEANESIAHSLHSKQFRRCTETFIIYPGDILLATDHTGSGHKWRLMNDDPWKRVYVVFEEKADTFFIPDEEEGK